MDFLTEHPANRMSGNWCFGGFSDKKIFTEISLTAFVQYMDLLTWTKFTYNLFFKSGYKQLLLCSKQTCRLSCKTNKLNDKKNCKFTYIFVKLGLSEKYQ